MKKSVAIITARGGSKRIINKNIKDFCGLPMISYSIRAAIDSGCFDEVIVSTDDQNIADISRSFGAKVPFMRSEKNSNDYATTSDALREVLLDYEKIECFFDYVCCIYPTAVFIDSNRLQEANKVFLESSCDALIPVTKYSFPIQRALKIEDKKVKFLHPENEMVRSQDLEDFYHDCGQFYFVDVKEFLSQKKLFMKNTAYLITEESMCQDIDNESDFEIAKIKYQALHKDSTI